MRLAVMLSLLVACGGGGDAEVFDAGIAVDSAQGAKPDAPGSPDAAVFDPGPEPTAPIQPVHGEVTIIQLDLPATLHGEAAIIIGPNGTIALLDIGNSPHDDDVLDRIRDLNTNWLTPARGFAARGDLQVEWILITHLHGDHIGAFQDLMIDAAENPDLMGGVVHRGFVDLGDGMNTSDYEEFCAGMRGPYAAFDVPLCTSAVEPSCDYTALVGSHPAASCDGLLSGDLADASDDALGEAAYIDLGDGARITIVGVNGWFNDGDSIVPMTFGVDLSDEENARSLAGIVSHGKFRYHFGGDMHGRPEDGPDVESHLVATSGAAFYGDLGVDVAHAHHHARRTSSNARFVGAMAPQDGRSRNVTAGANPAHLGSPFAEMLAAWGDGDRLADGKIWITSVTVGGATSAELVDADGDVIVQTIQRGLGYRVQAAGAALQSQAYPSLR